MSKPWDVHLLAFYAERISYFYLKKLGFRRFPTKALNKQCSKYGEKSIKSPDFIKVELDFISGVEVKSFTSKIENLHNAVKEASEQLRYCDYRVVHIHTWDDRYDGKRVGRFMSVDKVVMFKDGQYQRTILGSGRERKWKTY